MTTEPLSPSQRFSRGLTLLVATPLALAGLFVIAVTSAHAAAPDDGASSVRLHHVDRAPATQAAAAQLYHRLDKAALTVCGGGDSSLAEFNRSLRDSACWHDAMRSAFAQIDSPRLPVALADSRKP